MAPLPVRAEPELSMPVVEAGARVEMGGVVQGAGGVAARAGVEGRWWFLPALGAGARFIGGGESEIVFGTQRSLLGVLGEVSTRYGAPDSHARLSFLAGASRIRTEERVLFQSPPPWRETRVPFGLSLAWVFVTGLRDEVELIPEARYEYVGRDYQLFLVGFTIGGIVHRPSPPP
jgi:hypothetical protein